MANVFLKATISEGTRSALEALARMQERSMSDLVRSIVTDYVESNRSRITEETVTIVTERPPGYDYGAWTVRVSLGQSVPSRETPRVFLLPKVKGANLVSDREYVAVYNHKRGGLFIDGRWLGHIYSPAIASGSDDLSLESIVEEIRMAVEQELPPRASR